MGKMRIFLDTNVMVDFCAEREPFYSDAASIIEMGYEGKVTPIASSLTFVNIAYVLRKVKPHELVIQKLEQLMDLCVVSPIDRQIISSASSSRPKDFEETHAGGTGDMPDGLRGGGTPPAPHLAPFPSRSANECHPYPFP